MDLNASTKRKEEGFTLFSLKKFEEAFPILLKFALEGDAKAQYEVAYCYYFGYGVNRDFEQAGKWYEASALQDYLDAYFALANCFSKGLGKQKDLQKALYWYEKAGANGSAEGQFEAANLYFNGNVGNKEQAIYWYELAAKQDHIGALTRLGWCYRYGRIVEKNVTKGMEYYQKAAELGFSLAQLRMGDFYTEKKDYEQAFDWYLRSAENGENVAQNSLGVCYYFGLGTKEDYEKAASWFLKSALQNNKDAKNNLSVCYKNGYGVPKDINESVKWLIAAANQYHIASIFRLGFCYATGHGIKQNLEEAEKYLGLAIKLGYDVTNYHLDAIYMNDSEVKMEGKVIKTKEENLNEGFVYYAIGKYFHNDGEDLKKASYWYHKAVDCGIEVTKEELDDVGFEKNEDLRMEEIRKIILGSLTDEEN
ncbi:MAG: sel1 repeat family protein [Anaeroplasmataceae bacterium]|nr:sel1 repeat family protein [Anaeroplasmataceae bacterium]